MLSKILHGHLDEMDLIDEKVRTDVDKIFSSIDKQALIKDPQKVLLETIEEVKKILVSKYQPQAAVQGIDLAKEIKKRDVVVDPSKDPNKNEEVNV